MKRRLPRWTLLLAALSAPLAALASGLMVMDPWVREAPPNARMMAGYLTLMNHGREPVTVVGAESPQFKRVEIHRTRIEGGMARMEKQASVTVPAGERLRFAPGGYHLMLMMPKRRLKAGDEVTLILRLADGERITVQAPVRKGQGGEGHAHGHDHHAH